MIDTSKFRIQPYAHQAIGIEKLVQHPFFALLDEMGAGKTFQVINGALLLSDVGVIDQVIIVCPAAVRSVWFDPELGELAKWLWANTRNQITEYHAKSQTWHWFKDAPGSNLKWIITNYDFIRNPVRRKQLLDIASEKTLLVLDESSAVKTWNAQQTKACKILREKCGRVVLLNGTPIANSPGDLYSQADIMNPLILKCKTYFHFRSLYARMGGYQGRQIIGWHRIEEIQAKMAPYVLRRLKKDCLDLPDKIPSVSISVPLTPASWKIYKDMKEEMVVWLSSTDVSFAAQAIVKVVRLAQITSGFIGGVEYEEDLFSEVEDPPAFIQKTVEVEPIARPPQQNVPVREVGREKLDAFLSWLKEQLYADPNLKLLVWSRFRPEVKRVHEELASFTSIERGMIWGGQTKADRAHALRLLDPRTAPPGPVVVIGTPATGSMGLNLTAAHTVVYLSNDFSLKTRLQSEDRVHRPGQINHVSYFDFIATGPAGQKTIDHAVVKALRSKEDLANFTTSAWLDVLSE